LSANHAIRSGILIKPSVAVPGEHFGSNLIPELRHNPPMDVTSPNVASVMGAGRAKGLGGWLNFAGHFHNCVQLLTQWLYLADVKPESPEPGSMAAPFVGSSRHVVLAINLFFLPLSTGTVALLAQLALNRVCHSQSFVRRKSWTMLSAAV
jgi:hypothetical protein